MSSFESINKQELQAAYVNNAIEQGIVALENRPSSDAGVKTFSWLRDQADIGYSYADPGNLNLARVIRPGKDQGRQTIVFVEEGDAASRMHPDLRVRPQYVPNLKTTFMPSEVAAHPTILAGVLLHEAVHAIDHANPDVAKAKAVFPGVHYEKGLDLLSELRAFQLEGDLLVAMLGESFATYLQTEIDVADKQAIKEQRENKGLRLSGGIDVPVVRQFLEQNVSFTSEVSRDCAYSLLNTALPIYLGMRVIDQIMERNSDKQIPESTVLGMKAGLLSEGYLY